MDEKEALKEAVEAAKNSNCTSKRGVIIWHREYGLMSSGWNAPPKPLICDGSEACRANCAKTALHAEQMALLGMLHYYEPISECEMIHVKIIDSKAVISDKPSCWQCSKLILGSGLQAMWLYQKEGLVRYTPEEFHNETLKNCNLI